MITNKTKKELKKTKKIYRHSAFLLYFMMAIFWGYIIYFLLPIKVFEIQKEPAPILTKRVKMGDILQYNLQRVKFFDVPTEITYQFFDGVAYFIPYVFLTHQSVGVRNSNIGIQVPAISPGKYRVRVTIRSILPLFKSITDTFITEEFEIYKELE
ncbi:MAG: hypothetical protein UT24_C0029G0023 [Candidatus Woesebacteria bacterium GW2011_GWB1_39_12]|uniref:Uncharacterized protein n=1 Tax=Candidatus Woesebacteria bacterium GW2011_GWB1_39_12 TaxID=1618574 RepID=A0A0G0QBC3_9BACT|nr:MAG: hypothetical protein UT24_C0029G0023 [Candidatus Woesebacteria bacterium GW2011_GWB1_39_12]